MFPQEPATEASTAGAAAAEPADVGFGVLAVVVDLVKATHSAVDRHFLVRPPHSNSRPDFSSLATHRPGGGEAALVPRASPPAGSAPSPIGVVTVRQASTSRFPSIAALSVASIFCDLIPNVGGRSVRAGQVLAHLATNRHPAPHKPRTRKGINRARPVRARSSSDTRRGCLKKPGYGERVVRR